MTWVSKCSVLFPFYTVVLVFMFSVLSILLCGLVSICVICPFYTVMWVGWCLCSIHLLHCAVGCSVFVFYVPSTL